MSGLNLKRKIRVLIVDDSPVVRQLLRVTLEQSDQLEVVGTAGDPYLAVQKIKELNPDVLTLDVEMPKMNGLEFLKRLMIAHPLPVVMVSTLTLSGSKVTLKALELGAVDFVAKPNLSDKEEKREFQREIISKVETAAKVDIRKLKSHSLHIADKSIQLKKDTSNKLIAIGASTGGVTAIRNILPHFPKSSPGIIIVQHMPQGFTKTFADNLDKISSIKVKEAEDGDQVLAGQALVVPGGYHMKIIKKGSSYYSKLITGPKVNYQRPAVDVTFGSLAQIAGAETIGVLLTGMGKDGAKGLKMIKDTGGYTLVQNQETSTIFGMPKQAIELGAASEIVALNQIPSKVIDLLND
ncbi:two-component system chemotaxis response regulator CheB [Orenia metallireducens]|jgi:two-component system chemotaxis response regulator CheB|uniref:Protein-glutamate methylesterase/protein-glutamine glutaminase n=1 Tax=Orenia metallireducens TaxID=1413210 RepID=A0A285HFZ7_9FIRM|nr:chemotaxis response regulator protein-glutamate methylesterase [Orenia metallireducens]PRX27477.1 two-component system chemotaxis response regulator CheB [Orenia metallireducens]SNY34679.1 two-component system, chemotaxis family, response regulator CheB [Orenia metallireducens]